jgi:replicative DNA helicase
MINLKEASLNLLKSIEKGPENTELNIGLSSGFRDIDTAIGRLQKGNLIVIGSRPGTAKTSLALSIVREVAKNTRDSIVIFSYQKPANQILQMITAAEAEIDIFKFNTNNFSQEDLRKVTGAIHSISNLRIYIEDSGTLDLNEVRALSSKIKSESGLGMILIDGLQEMPIKDELMENAVKDLKQMSIELEVPVLITTQIRRPKKNIERYPRLKDLKDVYPLSYFADSVLFIHLSAFFNPETTLKGVVKIICYNNRQGSVTDFRLRWVSSKIAFHDF